jgi:hypothetical protein
MVSGHSLQTRAKKSYPETDESGTFWISTLLDMDSRLRIARGIGKNETEASKKAFQMLQQRGHPEAPPPLITDGWGGIDDAILDVYGMLPEYSGRGRPPSNPKPGKDWLYLQMVKQRNQQGRLQGIKLKAIWGSKSELIKLLGKSTAYIERSNLTARIFNARLNRKSLAFSKELQAHEHAVIWEDAYYNWIRPHKSLRLEIQKDPKRRWQPRTPGMVAGLTDHVWTMKELFFAIPFPNANNT